MKNRWWKVTDSGGAVTYIFTSTSSEAKDGASHLLLKAERADESEAMAHFDAARKERVPS